MDNGQIFYVVAVTIVAGVITSFFAKQRGRDPGFWFFMGVVLGLVGLILLIILPKKNVETDKDTAFLEETEARYADVPKEGWYYASKDRKITAGPVDLEQLGSAFKEGNVDLVWNDGMENWKKIEEMQDLMIALENDGKNE